MLRSSSRQSSPPSSRPSSRELDDDRHHHDTAIITAIITRASARGPCQGTDAIRGTHSQNNSHQCARTMPRYRCAEMSTWSEGGSERRSLLSARKRSPSSVTRVI